MASIIDKTDRKPLHIVGISSTSSLTKIAMLPVSRKGQEPPQNSIHNQKRPPAHLTDKAALAGPKARTPTESRLPCTSSSKSNTSEAKKASTYTWIHSNVS